MIKKSMKRIQVMNFLIPTFFLLLIGCGELNEKTLGNEADWEDGHGVLSDQIGSPDSVTKEASPPLPHYFEDVIEIIEQTEYDMPTSRWFMHDDEGAFGYGLPSGTMKAGAEYTIKLFAHHEGGLQVDRDVRIQLTTRDQDGKQSDLVMEDSIHLDTINGEEEIYINQLPKAENMVYVLSVEVLGQQGQVEDTMVSMLYVPIPEIHAKLTTDKKVYSSSDEQATISLTNDGPTFLASGESYTIEKKVNHTWKVVPLDIGFEDIGILINPGNTYDQIMALDQLSPGEYRVIKTFNTDGLDLSATLSAGFTIE